MASVGYAQNGDDFLTNLAVNGVANAAGLKAEQLPIFRASTRPLIRWGKKLLNKGLILLLTN